VTSGPFRLSRNPLYVSLVATLAAFGILLDSAWHLPAAALLALALDRFVVREEERRLGELFGEAYAEYRARVRRWL
jgi:protein-S-isoprenylcysteine O-methyltransferase Ste14